MDVQEVATLTALAALAAGAAAFVIALALVLGPRVPALDRLAWWVRDHSFALAAVVALAATLGSLYYSEIADYIPCRYCWFQRIAMYPLIVVCGVAALTRDEKARPTALVLATGGIAVSIWHWLIQNNPDWASEGSCSITAPCSSKLVEEFGFVTIPFMAGAGFLLIIVLMVTGLVLRDPQPSPSPQQEIAES